MAKILGNYMPVDELEINDCKITNQTTGQKIHKDYLNLPIRSRSDELFLARKGNINTIHYSQSPISTRLFESDYFIETLIATYSGYDALKIANDKFIDCTSALSLAAKRTPYKLKNKDFYRGDACFDFEMVAIFEKRNDEWSRIREPDPLITVRNFEPKIMPEELVKKATTYIEVASKNQTFNKANIYFTRTIRMQNSGYFNRLEISINLVKCIELIATNICDDKCEIFKEFNDKKHGTKHRIICAGRKLSVSQKNIDYALEAWSHRNKSDVAHQHHYYNPYSKLSESYSINIEMLYSSTAEFLDNYSMQKFT